MPQSVYAQSSDVIDGDENLVLSEQIGLGIATTDQFQSLKCLPISTS